MSLTSKNDNSNYLILDFGINPESKGLITFVKNDNENQLLELNPSQMKNEDWDHVLDLIIKNKKCITL